MTGMTTPVFRPAGSRGAAGNHAYGLVDLANLGDACCQTQRFFTHKWTLRARRATESLQDQTVTIEITRARPILSRLICFYGALYSPVSHIPKLVEGPVNIHNLDTS